MHARVLLFVNDLIPQTLRCSMFQDRFEIVEVDPIITVRVPLRETDTRPGTFFGQSLEHFYVYKNCIVHGFTPLSSVIVFPAVHMHVCICA